MIENAGPIIKLNTQLGWPNIKLNTQLGWPNIKLNTQLGWPNIKLNKAKHTIGLAQYTLSILLIASTKFSVTNFSVF